MADVFADDKEVPTIFMLQAEGYQAPEIQTKLSMNSTKYKLSQNEFTAKSHRSNRFQALITNLPSSVDALTVWHRYERPGRLGKPDQGKLGEPFGIKRICVKNSGARKPCHHLAITAYNLCALLRRRLGQLEKCELNTLRWRLFGRAAVWSRADGKPALKLAAAGADHYSWWREMLAKLAAASHQSHRSPFPIATTLTIKLGRLLTKLTWTGNISPPLRRDIAHAAYGGCVRHACGPFRRSRLVGQQFPCC